MGTAVSKLLSWCVFALGVAGASIGIVALHVEVAVFGLIVASTSGLILLKMRAEAHGRLEHGVEGRAGQMVGGLSTPQV